MTRILPALLVGVMGAAAGHAADEGAPPTWRLSPTLYVLGTLDDTTGIAQGLNQELLEPPRSFSLGGALDGEWAGDRTRAQGSLLGLVHSPLSADERGLLAAGRVHLARDVGNAMRVTLDDAGRVQHRPELELTDYARNEVVLGIEWQPIAGPAWALRLSDRRRGVTELERLGFSRQALAAAATWTLGPGWRLSLDAGIHHFGTKTARGEGGVVTCEAAHLTRRRTIVLRGAWFLPIRHRSIPSSENEDAVLNYVVAPEGAATLVRGPSPQPAPPLEVEPVLGDTLLLADSPVGRSTAGDPAVGAFVDPFLFDPLESDTDEWDFGRHKQVGAILLSQPIGARTRLSMLARYQRSSGPNLLLDPGTSSHTVENRLWARMSLRHRAWTHLSVFSHAGILLNRSTDDTQDFSRVLVTAGVEIPF